MADADRLYGPTGPKKYNSTFITAFGISFLLLLGYALGYALFFALFAGAFPETGSFLAVWVPPLTVGITVSVLACLPMRYMKKTLPVPIAMGILAFYYLALAVSLLRSRETADPRTALYVLSLFCLPCIIPGNILAWVMWRRWPGTEKEDGS